MKVVLAGCENWYFAEMALIAGCNNILFSYHYMKDKNEKEYANFFNLLSPDMEVICDSGLFTLMFGAGKGGVHTLDSMKDYAKKYIAFSKLYPHKNLTIVECDVHKLLGMKAVFELRKLFEDSGMRVLYTWHREEGIDGLYEMARKYNYIALSVPELRVICKEKIRYQDAVMDLLRKIEKNTGKIPKIHLLGNTVQETMETNLAYSCDSTSWLAGCRYGRFMKWDGKKLKPTPIRSSDFEIGKQILINQFPDHYEALKKWAEFSEKKLNYQVTAYLSAFAYVQYQRWLDRNYQFKGDSSWT